MGKSKKTFYDNHQFDSMLEVSFYKVLKTKGITFIPHPPTVTLQEGYTALAVMKSGKISRSKIRSISYTTDFELKLNNGHSIFIEAKGWWRSGDASKIRWKMFHNQLAAGDYGFVAKNLKELNLIIDFYRESNLLIRNEDEAMELL